MIVRYLIAWLVMPLIGIGEIWLESKEGYHRVIQLRHPSHQDREECMVEFVLATPIFDEDGEIDADNESRRLIWVKGSHQFWEGLTKYDDERRADDVVVISSSEKDAATFVDVMPREAFQKSVRERQLLQQRGYIT